MTLEQRVGEITDYFEVIVGGPDEAGKLLAPWPVELCAAMFMDAAVSMKDTSPRLAAIIVWSLVMHAYLSMETGPIVH